MVVKNTDKNREKCVCFKCPSYPRDCRGEVLFCSEDIGASKCDIDAKGCICNICPVYFENNLIKLYFCDKEEVGEAKVLMRKIRMREDKDFYQTVTDIKIEAKTGESIIRSMGSRKKMPFSFDDLHFIPAQVDKIPLNSEDRVGTEVLIGPNAKKILKLSSPIIISGMSYGATSKNVRLVISKVAGELKIGFNSGEGGILNEELERGVGYLIGQYATGRFGVDEERLKQVSAVEIRFGQGAYPGKGSFLPAEKMTPEIAKARGLKGGEPAYSPAHHHDMRTSVEIRAKVDWLREITGGVPIGAKIGCGNIEKDIEVLIEGGVDFISIDGFGGGTGATDFYARENVGIPLVAALPRAFKFLTEKRVKDKISLIAGGGLRTSADFTKCLALGADAVYIGTAALIAINCEQYRICHTGLCPTGVTTHKPVLEKQLNVDEGVSKLNNFIKLSIQEISNFARIIGKNNINKLDKNDLVSLNKDFAKISGVQWLDGRNINHET